MVLAPIGLAQTKQQVAGEGQIVVNEKDLPPDVLAKIRSVQKVEQDVSAVPAEAKQWKDEILERVDALAKKIGTTVEHLWMVLARQGYIEGCYGIFWLILGIGMTIGAIRHLSGTIILCTGKFELKEKKGDETSVVRKSEITGTECTRITKTIILCILGLVFLITAGVYITDIGYLFNPEYFALQQMQQIFGH
ncbi:MAG: hypothetical protein ABR875_02830 [Minisyncoccia bacterium]